MLTITDGMLCGSAFVTVYSVWIGQANKGLAATLAFFLFLHMITKLVTMVKQ